jgi:hypothetical protein
MDVPTLATAGTVLLASGTVCLAITRIAIARMALRGTKPEQRAAILHALAEIFRSRVR